MEQKERLEQELKFLKESLEADIITKEEYNKGKQRIEDKLKELSEEPKEEKIVIKEIQEEEASDEEREIEEFARDITNNKGHTEKPAEETEEVEEEEKEEEAPEEGEKEEPKSEESEIIEEKPIKTNKPFLWAVIGIILIFLIYFFLFKSPAKMQDITPLSEKVVGPLEQAACGSDFDCREAGKVGICINPSTKEAKCEFREPVEVSLIVLNDQNCISCDTTRMLSVIEQLFPDVKKIEINSNSKEGKELINKLKIDMLPAYVFDEDITKTVRYEKFKRALTKVYNKHIINSAASGADYYFKREETPNTLDLFVDPELNSSLRAETNIKEVLGLFGGDIKFNKHFLSDDLAKELGITTSPTFLINNIIKFTGVQPAETIKNKFCQLNAIEECSTKLSTDIK